MKRDWQALAEGRDCPFDNIDRQDQSSLIHITDLSVSALYLDRNQVFPGHCVLVFGPRHVTRIDNLSAAEWLDLAKDIYTAEVAIFRACSPDHMNVESLGNVVPHLHWHIIPRYRSDPRWGSPVWGTGVDDPGEVLLDAAGYTELAGRIRELL